MGILAIISKAIGTVGRAILNLVTSLADVLARLISTCLVCIVAELLRKLEHELLAV